MKLYSVGDRVTVKSERELINEWGESGKFIKTPVVFTPSMRLFCGKTVTISSVSDTSCTIKEDPRGFCFWHGVFIDEDEGAALTSDFSMSWDETMGFRDGEK